MAVWLTMNMSYVGPGDYANTSKVAVSVDVHWSHVSYNRDGGALTVTVDGVSDSRTVPFNAGETSSGSQNIYSYYWNISQPNGNAKTISAYATFQATNQTAATPASATLSLAAISGSGGGGSGSGDSGGGDTGDDDDDGGGTTGGGTTGGGDSGGGQDNYTYERYVYCKDQDGNVLAIAHVSNRSGNTSRVRVSIQQNVSDEWRIREKGIAGDVILYSDNNDDSVYFNANYIVYVFEIKVNGQWVHSRDASSSFLVATYGIRNDSSDPGNFGGPDGTLNPTGEDGYYLWIYQGEGTKLTVTRVYTEASAYLGELTDGIPVQDNYGTWYKHRVWNDDFFTITAEALPGYTIDTYDSGGNTWNFKAYGIRYATNYDGRLGWNFDPDDMNDEPWILTSATKDDTGDDSEDDSDDDDVIVPVIPANTRGVVYISNGTDFSEYELCIDNGTGWDRVVSQSHRVETGTITTNANGIAFIDCSFFPDFVFIRGNTLVEAETDNIYNSMVGFSVPHDGDDYNGVWCTLIILNETHAKDEMIDVRAHSVPDMNRVMVIMSKRQTSGYQGSVVTHVPYEGTFEYTAFKYT